MKRAGAARRILAFHVCDWRLPTRDLVFDRAMMGDGAIDLRKIRGMVEAAGYEGFIEAEIFSATGGGATRTRFCRSSPSATGPWSEAPDRIKAPGRDQGMAVVPVEQHGELARRVCPRSIVINRGRIVDDGPSTTLAADPERLHGLVGVARRGRLPSSTRTARVRQTLSTRLLRGSKGRGWENRDRGSLKKRGGATLRAAPEIGSDPFNSRHSVHTLAIIFHVHDLSLATVPLLYLVEQVGESRARRNRDCLRAFCPCAAGDLQRRIGDTDLPACR